METYVLIDLQPQTILKLYILWNHSILCIDVGTKPRKLPILSWNHKQLSFSTQKVPLQHLEYAATLPFSSDPPNKIEH